MHTVAIRSLVTVLLTLTVVGAAGGQTVAASFEDLQRLLNPGEIVIVTDVAGVTTWGRVEQISSSSLTIGVLERIRDGRATLSTGVERAFPRDRIGAIVRSDASGRRGTHVYPASWAKVDEIPPGAEVAIELDSGTRDRFRFKTATASALEVVAASGRDQTFEKARIRRVQRLRVDDPIANGTIAGALTGAGAMFAITAVLYARCDAGCDAPARGPTFLTSMAVGSAAGAAAGWIIDRLRKGARQVYPLPPPGSETSSRGYPTTTTGGGK